MVPPGFGMHRSGQQIDGFVLICVRTYRPQVPLRRRQGRSRLEDADTRVSGCVEHDVGAAREHLTRLLLRGSRIGESTEVWKEPR